MPFPVTQGVTLDRGIPILAIAAAVNADATTVTKSQIFAIQPCQSQAMGRYQVEAAAAGTVTGLTVDHEVSQDGGVTWTKRGATIDMGANREGSVNLVPGDLNRFKPATLVLGTAASVSVTLNLC